MVTFANYLLMTCGFFFIMISIHYVYMFTKRKKINFPLLFAMWVITFMETLLFFFIANNLIKLEWVESVDSFLFLSGISFYIFLVSFVIYAIKQIGYTVKIVYSFLTKKKLFLKKKKEKDEKVENLAKPKRELGLFWSKKY